MRIARFMGSNAIGLVALIVAIGGTAYAGTQVGGDDLRPFKVKEKSGQIPARGTGDVDVKCKGGSRFISGGYEAFGADFSDKDIDIIGASPLIGKNDQPTGFEVVASNGANQAQEIFAQAVCLKR